MSQTTPRQRTSDLSVSSPSVNRHIRETLEVDAITDPSIRVAAALLPDGQGYSLANPGAPKHRRLVKAGSRFLENSLLQLSRHLDVSTATCAHDADLHVESRTRLPSVRHRDGALIKERD